MSNSSESPVIKHSVFNPIKDINYLKAKTNKSGGKSVGIRLMMECPLMLTWGANKFTDEITGRTTYKMSLAFPRPEYSTPETDKFLQRMLEMETKIKEDATTHSMEWFNKPKDKMPLQVVDALFNPLLKWPKDPLTGERDMTKTPTLDIKLENYDGFNCELYDIRGEMLFPDKNNTEITPLTLIPKFTNIAAIIQCGGIWFAGGKFGVTWKLFQGVIQQRASLKGKCLISLSTNEMKELNKSTQDQEEDEVDSSSTLELAEDSDVEEEPTSETVSAPAQIIPESSPVVKKVVKKVIRKKD